MDIEWPAHEQTQQQSIEINISLHRINTVHKIENIYVFENNATIFRKDLSLMVMNLSANTEYEWMVSFKYNGRSIELAFGLFNTSEECENNNGSTIFKESCRLLCTSFVLGYSVTTVVSVSSIGIILILVGAPIAVIIGLFWVYKLNRKDEHASEHYFYSSSNDFICLCF